MEMTEEQKIIRKNIRKFLAKELDPVVVEYDEKGIFPKNIFQKLGALGFLGSFFPSQYGGGNTDLLTYSLITEEICRVDAGFGMSCFASSVLFGRNILHQGNEEQKKKYLPPIIRGEKIGCWALTEPQAGSDSLAIQTTFEKNGDMYVINGSKTFITNAPVADYFIVLTRKKGTSGVNGGTAFVLERGMEGLSTGKPFNKMGMRTSPTGEIFLENVKVLKNQILGEEDQGFYAMFKSLDIERSLGICQPLGVAQACLEASLAYAKGRVQFGQPIASFQLIQEKLAEMAMNIELSRTYGYYVLKLAEKGNNIAKEAAILGCFTPMVTTRCALEAVQIHGGYGYMKEYRVEKYLRDAKLFEIGGGTNEIMKLIVARLLLKESH
jgi:alkylation response protein AidB-like acyl-CoA dehydrogenase